MYLGETRWAVGRFSNRPEAQQALGELTHAGFLVTQIFIVAIAGCNESADLESGDRAGAVREKAAVGAVAGGMIGAICGWLASLGVIVVPGVGLLAAAGTTGMALVTIFTGTGLGAASGSLILPLAIADIPSKQARVVRGSCLQDEFLVMVDGTDDEVRRAKFLLSKSSSSQVWVC